MAVADLGMSLTDYRNEACAELFAGGATEYDDLDAGEQADIDRYILRGEHTFWLHPPGVGPYVWSCLRDPGLLDLWGTVAVDADVTVTQSTTTMTASAASFYETMIGKSVVVTSEGTFTITGYTSSTVVTVAESDTYATPRTFSIASDGTYRLPTDFESPDSSTLRFTDNSYPDIPLIEGREVTTARALNPDGTGYPRMAYIRWRASDGTAAQGQELVVSPDPDAGTNYEVALPFMVQPQGMTEANPYPRGGPEMADCLLSVILGICEKAKNGQRGDRWAEATEKCIAAAARDRTRHHNFIAGRMLPDAGNARYPFSVKNLIQPA